MKTFKLNRVIVPLCCLLLAKAAYGESTIAGRPWTVEDSVAVRYFVTEPSSLEPWMLSGALLQPIVVAPGGNHFFFVTFYGDLKRDHVVYELHIFATHQVREALRRAGEKPRRVVPPLRQVAFRSARGNHGEAAIQQPAWEDAENILFRGIEDRGRRRLYRLNIPSGELRPLTPEKYEVSVSFPEIGLLSAANRGRSIVFFSGDNEPLKPLDQYPVLTLKDDELSSFVYPERWVSKAYVSLDGGSPRLALSSNELIYGPWLSPNGQWAVVAYAPRDQRTPPKWQSYERTVRKAYRFELIDVKSGHTRAMLEAPVGTVTNVGKAHLYFGLWSADSTHVVLVNTALPIRHASDERQRMSYIVDYSVATHRWSVIEPLMHQNGSKVKDVGWLLDGKELLVTHETPKGRPGEGTRYTLNKNRWTGQQVARSVALPALTANLPRDLMVGLHESANDPPVMIASEGRAEVALTPPDPALEGIQRVPVQTIHWTDSEGNPVESLLMSPPFSSNTQPSPLVIQFSAVRNPPTLFRPDGQPGTGFAAQSLAAQGFTVLQTEPAAWSASDISLVGTPKELPVQVRRVDEAVDMLVKRGAVDRSPIGLIGFSRSGYYTTYVATHPGRTRLGAAVVFDSITGGYGEYVSSAGMGDMDPRIYEQQYGGTFWEKKSEWLADSPAFNMDKVRAPILVNIAGAQKTVASLELIGASRISRKPFEYLIYPQGAHAMQMPRERQAAMQSTVDWMNFWLQGRERAAEDAPDRFDRWRTMKAAWQQTLAEEASAHPTVPTP